MLKLGNYQFLEVKRKIAIGFNLEMIYSA